MRSYGFFGGGLTGFQTRPLTPPLLINRLSPPNTLLKAHSTSAVPTMSTMVTPPMPQNGFPVAEADYLNTIPDPRTPSPSQQFRLSDSSQHPDLSNEVAMLSTKLINAINHQTNLDDTLQHTRHELEASKQRVAQLELENKEHADLVTSGVLVKKAEVDATMAQLRAELNEAKQQREESDKAKKQMEVELENLTSALFEEANTMVASARKDNEAAEKRNAQLRSQLNDTELLLASQQEQLQDLKGVMEKLSSERDETETAPHPSTAPSTPGPDTANKMSLMFDTDPSSPGMSAEIAPDQPLRFSHLLSPVMRTDLQAYNDFADLLKTSRPLYSHGRSTSGNASGLKSSNGSSTALPSASSSSPSLPGSFSLTSSPREATFNTTPALKDGKFYKRCLVEDIEPTLRLDLAPGLSWLARRAVTTAITAGTLIVEPFAAPSRFYGPSYACALCGEDRRGDAYARRHRFRTSDDDNAQRYPLCEYCLGRVRATGDFAGFLRMIRDGLWRAKNEEEIKSAWEESTKLREKMFWARIGGGVVPASFRGESPIVAARRGDPGLSRMHSSTSLKVSMDAVRASRPSQDSQGQVRTPDAPKAENPLGGEHTEKRTSIENAIDTASKDDTGASRMHDFASPEQVEQQGSSGTGDGQSDDTKLTADDSAATVGKSDESTPVATQISAPEGESASNDVPSSSIPGSFD